MSLDFTNVTSVTIPEGDVMQIAIGGSTVWKRQPPAGYWEVTRYDGTAPTAGTLWVVRLSDGATGYYAFATSAFTAVSFAVGDVVGHDDIMFSVDVSIASGHMSQYVSLNGGTYKCVCWGDGTVSAVATGAFSVNHTYATAGTYTVKTYAVEPTSITFYSSTYPYNATSEINGGIPWSTIKNVDWAFHNAYIVSVPPTIFQKCVGLESVQETFSGCRRLHEIPAGIFNGCEYITTFSACFANCVLVSEIPEHLFDSCRNAKNFYACFYKTAVQSIPDGLFDNNPLATNFKWCFYNAPITSIDSDVFGNCPLVSDFTECFINCNSVTGSLPELWNTHSSATHTQCFTGCTQATNYATAQAKGWA